ncbi:MAG: hypothetical protein GY928_12645 [Colwellia sp.]|nr:hypothetical protein [Colwellia sp.]
MDKECEQYLLHLFQENNLQKLAKECQTRQIFCTFQRISSFVGNGSNKFAKDYNLTQQQTQTVLKLCEQTKIHFWKDERRHKTDRSKNRKKKSRLKRGHHRAAKRKQKQQNKQIKKMLRQRQQCQVDHILQFFGRSDTEISDQNQNPHLQNSFYIDSQCGLLIDVSGYANKLPNGNYQMAHTGDIVCAYSMISRVQVIAKYGDLWPKRELQWPTDDPTVGFIYNLLLFMSNPPMSAFKNGVYTIYFVTKILFLLNVLYATDSQSVCNGRFVDILDPSKGYAIISQDFDKDGQFVWEYHHDLDKDGQYVWTRTSAEPIKLNVPSTNQRKIYPYKMRCCKTGSALEVMEFNQITLSRMLKQLTQNIEKLAELVDNKQ